MSPNRQIRGQRQESQPLIPQAGSGCANRGHPEAPVWGGKASKEVDSLPPVPRRDETRHAAALA